MDNYTLEELKVIKNSLEKTFLIKKILEAGGNKEITEELINRTNFLIGKLIDNSYTCDQF